MADGDELSGSASEVFALVILAVAFLWIAALGNSRLLKVLDKRHFLLGALNKNNNNLLSQRVGLLVNGGNNNNNTSYGTSPSKGGAGTPRQSMGTVRSNNSSYGGGAGGGVDGGSTGGVGNGVYASPFTNNLLCDNRFVFGLFAVVLGMGEASYLMLYLFVRGSKFTKGNDIAGDNVLSDTLTAPIAWFFFSLVAAILWTLRDLLDRVKSLLNSNNSNHSSPNHHHERTGTDLGSDGVPGSNLSSPPKKVAANSSSPTPIKNNNTNQKKTSSNMNPIDSEETVDTAISMKTHQHKNDDDDDEEHDDTYDEDDDDENENKKNKRHNHHHLPSENSEDELATPVVVKLSTNSGQFDMRTATGTSNERDHDHNNNNNESFAELILSLRPYRAVITIVAMLVILAISLIVSWIQMSKGEKDAANTQATVISSIISFTLMIWSIYSSVESIVVMRKIGIAAHRVVIAIIVMAIFLLVRGILIMPPVQSGLCDTTKDSFWSCVFLLSFVDCAGIGLILQILP